MKNRKQNDKQKAKLEAFEARERNTSEAPLQIIDVHRCEELVVFVVFVYFVVVVLIFVVVHTTVTISYARCGFRIAAIQRLPTAATEKALGVGVAGACHGDVRAI